MVKEPAAAAGCLTGFLAGCLVLIIPIMLLGFFGAMIGIYFWMLIHCLKYQIKDRTVWMLVTIFGGPIGAIIYFFNREKKQKPNLQEEKNIKLKI